MVFSRPTCGVSIGWSVHVSWHKRNEVADDEDMIYEMATMLRGKANTLMVTRMWFPNRGTKAETYYTHTYIYIYIHMCIYIYLRADAQYRLRRSQGRPERQRRERNLVPMIKLIQQLKLWLERLYFSSSHRPSGHCGWSHYSGSIVIGFRMVATWDTLADFMWLPKAFGSHSHLFKCGRWNHPATGLQALPGPEVRPTSA